MTEENEEVRRLKSLLRTRRLSWSERIALESKIRELERLQSNGLETILPGVFGVFDRPEPASSTVEDQSAEPIAGEKSQPTAPPDVPSTPSSEASLTPNEIDALTEQITEIADRIDWLRSVWARTLSPEIDREVEAWLVRLQRLAKKLPEELLTLILENRASLFAPDTSRYQQTNDHPGSSAARTCAVSSIARRAGNVLRHLLRDTPVTWS